MKVFMLIALCALSACQDSDEPALDLAAPTVDQAPRGLAPSSDLGESTDAATLSFCARLDAARQGAGPSDCAVAYFLALEQCTQQQTGSCSTGLPDGGNFPPSIGHLCWDDGSSAVYEDISGIHNWAYATAGIVRCDYQFHQNLMGTAADLFCLATQAFSCDAIPGAARPYNAFFQGGVFTCPDGTTVADVQPGICANPFTSLHPTHHCDRQGSASCTFPQGW